jgi:LytS/YehU family sensor histidine kinase
LILLSDQGCTHANAQAIINIYYRLGTILTYPWYWIISLLLLAVVLFVFTRWRVKAVRKQERAKADLEKKLFLLQAKALNAQMNPHFIFNCLNSIKSLVQMNENGQAVDYLNLFAKLTRSLMQYSEKFAVSLHDELNICRWYIELEKLRFGSKVQVEFLVDDEIDTTQITVPVLLIQPFIENAVWHGLVPKQKGNGLLAVKVNEHGRNLLCTIEDNGIGRAAAMRMNGLTRAHQSKGMSLSQERINLHNRQQENKVNIRVADKFDDDGEPDGTLVTITFINYRND